MWVDFYQSGSFIIWFNQPLKLLKPVRHFPLILSAWKLRLFVWLILMFFFWKIWSFSWPFGFNEFIQREFFQRLRIWFNDKVEFILLFFIKTGKDFAANCKQKDSSRDSQEEELPFWNPTSFDLPFIPKKKFIEISSPFLLHHFGFSKLRKVFFFPLKNSIYFFQPIRDRSNISLTKIRGLLFYFSSFLEQKWKNILWQIRPRTSD